MAGDWNDVHDAVSQIVLGDFVRPTLDFEEFREGFRRGINDPDAWLSTFSANARI